MKPNTPGFLGKRLKEAREARELSMQGLADLLGVTRQSISKYESGDQSPRPIVLDEISKVLRLPVDFFVNERPHDYLDSESPIFYRKLTSATKAVRARAERRYEWLQDISDYLGRFVEFPDVNLPDFDVPNDPNKISDSMIEDLAIQTRRFWKLGDGPISNVVWLLENNGVIVGRYAFDANELDAFSQYVIGTVNKKQFCRPHIVLGNDKESGVRSRFDIAHELGHLIIHKNISRNIFRDSRFHKIIESQANRFSGAFLFPSKSFFQEVSSVSLDSLRTLKPRWKLSVSMLLHRAKDLGLLSDEKYQNLQINLVRRGWKTSEPLDDEIPVEEPKLLRRAMEMLIEQEIQTRSDVLNALKIGRRDTEEIIGLSANYLAEKVADFDSLKIKSERLQGEKQPRRDQENTPEDKGVVLDFASRRRLEN